MELDSRSQQTRSSDKLLTPEKHRVLSMTEAPPASISSSTICISIMVPMSGQQYADNPNRPGRLTQDSTKICLGVLTWRAERKIVILVRFAADRIDSFSDLTGSCEQGAARADLNIDKLKGSRNDHPRTCNLGRTRTEQSHGCKVGSLFGRSRIFNTEQMLPYVGLWKGPTLFANSGGFSWSLYL